MGHTKGYDDQASSNSDVTYVYSTDDQLISRLEPSAPPDRTKATLYFYDPVTGVLSEEADGAGNTLARYLNDADGQALAQQGYRIASSVRDSTDTAGTWKWLLQDVNGNVATQVLDNQDVAEQATWDPYGRPEKAGSSQTDIKKKGSTLGFHGAITDKVTGNLVLGPRQYDTSTARFITPDVFVGSELDIGLEIDPLTGNRYLFAAANPVAYHDDGHGSTWFSNWTRKSKGPRSQVLITTLAPTTKPLITVPTYERPKPLINVPGPGRIQTLVNIPGARSGQILGNPPSPRGTEILAADEIGSKAAAPKKRVNLPSWRRVGINMGHIIPRHKVGGSAVGPRKDVFPESWTESEIEKAIRQAYRSGSKKRTADERVLIRGEYKGIEIEIWVNTEKRVIETAYPPSRRSSIR